MRTGGENCTMRTGGESCTMRTGGERSAMIMVTSEEEAAMISRAEEAAVTERTGEQGGIIMRGENHPVEDHQILLMEDMHPCLLHLMAGDIKLTKLPGDTHLLFPLLCQSAGLSSSRQWQCVLYHFNIYLNCVSTLPTFYLSFLNVQNVSSSIIAVI